MLYVADCLAGVTQLHSVVYVVCANSSTISRFSTTTRQLLTDINVKDLKDPLDIAACGHTSQLYIADWVGCIWRVSSDGEDIKCWLPKSPSDTLKPWTLSVTSARLLVSSHESSQLTQFDASGDELWHIRLSDYMKPRHAVESVTGTFIVSHQNRLPDQGQVSEVNTEGQVLRQFSSVLSWPRHIAVDSQGNIFVADSDNSRILLLDAQLTPRLVIIDVRQLKNKQPWRLHYMEQSGQLLVGFHGGVAVFDVLQRWAVGQTLQD